MADPRSLGRPPSGGAEGQHIARALCPGNTSHAFSMDTDYRHVGRGVGIVDCEWPGSSMLPGVIVWALDANAAILSAI